MEGDWLVRLSSGRGDARVTVAEGDGAPRCAGGREVLVGVRSSLEPGEGAVVLIFLLGVVTAVAEV